MSNLESAIADILGDSDAHDPSVVMAQPTAKPVPADVQTTEPKQPRTRNQRKLIPEVEGKVNVDADGTPFSGAVVYPRGYVKLILSKFSKFTVYANELEALAEWFRSDDYEAFRDAAKEAGLTDRKVSE